MIRYCTCHYGNLFPQNGENALKAADVSHTSGQLRIGQPVQRLEDQALLTGASRFIDDLDLPGAAHAVFVRSPHVHARVVSLDVLPALAAKGIFGVFTAAELSAAGIGPMRVTVPQKNRDGSAVPEGLRPVLAVDRVRFVGEAVAIVVAKTAREARDAAELVEVAYEELPPVTDPRAAVAAGNLALDWEGGDHRACDAAFARAAHVTKLKLKISRVSAAPIEPRGAAGLFDPATGRYTLHAPTQGSKAIQADIASTGLIDDPRALRVVTPECVGISNHLFPDPLGQRGPEKR